ncbi:Mitochondrial import inner membrane translocase subunit tim23 [Linderina macrospora]|uniref:Mitochondrial import inner membrane translocase subunit tim23 n=1 Tax=Linderina macrospora TaxID=4868 RepID=A0ACC1J7R4_9FUNG|nr:Mitochondrial import inner membrane translocase subunit tim23 [Linderina macrospora]
MSIFSVFSRGPGSQPQDSQPQQQTQSMDTVLLSDSEVDQRSQSYYQTSAPAQPSQPSSTSLALDQMQGGVSEFLSQVDFSAGQLNTVASPGGIEYLNLEEGPIHAGGVVPSRGWSDDLCYGTGTMYLLGLGTGGAWGFLEGLRSQHGANLKLRVNSVLNSMTRRGPFVGNSLGVMAMFYNILNSTISNYRDTQDMYNSIGAAAISGMLFKIGGGPRASIISGIICAGTVGVYKISVAAYKSNQEKKLSSGALTAPTEPQLAKVAM